MVGDWNGEKDASDDGDNRDCWAENDRDAHLSAIGACAKKGSRDWSGIVAGDAMCAWIGKTKVHRNQNTRARETATETDALIEFTPEALLVFRVRLLLFLTQESSSKIE